MGTTDAIDRSLQTDTDTPITDCREFDRRWQQRPVHRLQSSVFIAQPRHLRHFGSQIKFSFRICTLHRMITIVFMIHF